MYSQRDSRWASQRLGTVDGVTIGSAGCYTTALANLATDCGKDINPAQLDDIFTERSLYLAGDLCYDGILTNVYGDIPFAWSKQYDGPADLSQLNNDVTVKQILEVDGQPNNPGLQTHFVYFWDYVNGVVRVLDSWTGQLINLADVYGDPATCIYSIITYTFNPPATPAEIPPAHDPVAAPPPPPPVPTPTPPPPPSAPVVSPSSSVSSSTSPSTSTSPSDAPSEPLPPVPTPPAPEAPIDKFLSWLFHLIFFWTRKG